MRRLPSLAAIEAFVQVARLGSIKAAAEDLSLSSPALSRRIQTLESFVGRPLFERGHQSIRLNEDGEELMGLVAQPIETLANAIETMTSRDHVMRLRLGVPSLFASQRLIPHLPQLRKIHPKLHIDLDTAAHSLTRLGDGIDCAIALAGTLDPALYGVRIYRDNIYTVGARRLVQGPHAITRPEQLREMTVMIHRELEDTFDVWRTAVGMPDLEPAAIDYYDSGQLMLEAAAQGLGIAFLHQNLLSDYGDERLVRMFADIEVRSPYSYWFACRPRALDLQPVRLFRDWLVTLYQSD
ncbi:MAG: LysR family transcriptional regulator [Sphingomonadaceae bacterium]|jgi:LysR family glycine cleavage system transcriptional activator|nr:LysR family transcriptional regulator [Sphingomonadaceae bacterium]NBU79327.1 LysR family transcriptional regulator [Sphingomonadaceae bacterium]NCA01818.1 LysR family transcriptional regulator [Sphingomonadaceae bacterium]